MVAAQVPVGVVHVLEMIEVEHQKRERRLVTLGIGDFRGEPLFEMLAVIRARQRVEHARFVEPPERALLRLVGEPEAQLDVGTHRYAIPFRKRMLPGYAYPPDEGAVARAEILDHVFAGHEADDARVPTTDPAVENAHRAFFAAPDDVFVGDERIN